MRFKQFVEWATLRACDGCWSLSDAVKCISIINHFRNIPFYKREREWQKSAESKFVKELVAETENSHAHLKRMEGR